MTIEVCRSDLADLLARAPHEGGAWERLADRMLSTSRAAPCELERRTSAGEYNEMTWVSRFDLAEILDDVPHAGATWERLAYAVTDGAGRAHAPAAEKVTLNAIRLWAEVTIEANSDAAPMTRLGGFQAAARQVLAILDMQIHPGGVPQ